MTVSRTSAQPAAAADTPSALRARLVPPMPGSAFWGWVGPLLVTAFGTWLRFNRLSVPKAVIFDETYYVADALGILKFGVEHNYVANRNVLLVHGNPHIFASGGEFVVAPPVGKLFIAFGEWTLGLNPFGWRFFSALIGSLAILLLARITRRMTRSTLLGCVAGLLMALDGLEFVMSRVALLDIFLMFFVLASFGCLIVDRDVTRARLAAALEAAPGGSAPAQPGAAPGRRIRWGEVHWWRIGAGVCLGLAIASKWDAVWFIPAFIGLMVAWDIGARRAAGQPAGLGSVLHRQRWLPAWCGVLPVAVYLITWSGWFFTSSGYDRQWAAQNGIHVPVISALASFVEYQKQILTFHLGLTTHHPYQSQPWTWLVMSRPVAFFWQCPAAGTKGACGTAGTKAQEVLCIGTPLIYWASIATLLVCLGWWLSRRDWRAGAVLLMVALGWLPWFWFALHDHRTEFFYYTLEFEPFLIISIVLCLGLIIGSAQASPARRTVGAAVAGAYVLGVLLNFAYLYPIIAGKAIPYTSWLSHMWYHGWI